MTGLDGATYANLLDELPDIVRRSGATTLLVTHDRDEAFRLCDDLVVLVAGRVIAAGAKRAIATNPRRVEVARMLGYSVVTLSGRRLAIPVDELRFGAGTDEFMVRIEAVADLVREWDVIAVHDDARLHIRMPRAHVAPRPGDAVPVHARVMYDVS
jgi:ABC-type sulfate/molybdate transport systems ATPase subunit